MQKRQCVEHWAANLLAVGRVVCLDLGNNLTLPCLRFDDGQVGLGGIYVLLPAGQ